MEVNHDQLDSEWRQDHFLASWPAVRHLNFFKAFQSSLSLEWKKMVHVLDPFIQSPRTYLQRSWALHTSSHSIQWPLSQILWSRSTSRPIRPLTSSTAPPNPITQHRILPWVRYGELHTCPIFVNPCFIRSTDSWLTRSNFLVTRSGPDLLSGLVQRLISCGKRFTISRHS